MKLITDTALTPKLLLCRFVRDFVKVPATNICDLLGLKDKLLDMGLTGMMIPQFMNDPTYRALLNKAFTEKMYSVAADYFPNGECESFERISKECLV